MTQLTFLPLVLCMLGSCSLSDWSAQTTTPLSPTQTPVVQSGTTDTITSKISATTTETLKNAYSEELLAEAIYRDIVAKYPALASIDNIVQSEEKHSTQVGKLLTARGIALPTDFGIYADTYTTLKTLVDSSLTGAIEVGVMVEVGDIDHLLAEYLRAFLRFAEQYNYTPTTDYSKYMTAADLTTTGSLKSKMTELLQANNLPTSGVSGGQGGWQGRGRAGH